MHPKKKKKKFFTMIAWVYKQLLFSYLGKDT